MKSAACKEKSPSEIAKQNAILQDRVDAQAEEINRLKHQYANLLTQFKLAQKNRFGRSSEKNVDQMQLFDEAEANTSDKSEPEKQTITYERNAPKRTKLPESLPRETIEIDVSEEEKQCDCGCQKQRIGEEVTEKLAFIPATVKVLAYVRPKYACNKCDMGVAIAKMPKLFLPKSIATPSLVAQTIVSKYCDHLPLYRQEKIWQRYGIDIPRNTGCDWVMAAYEACEPINDVLIKLIRESSYNQADETPVLVRDEPGRKNTTKSYMWVYRRMDPEKPVVLFNYQPGRGAEYPKTILKGFKGYLQTDCYKGYDWVEKEKDIGQVACMAHARRPFAELVKIAKKTGKSHEALSLIRKLYAVERKAKENTLSFDERYQLRQQESLPIIKKLRAWLDRTILTAVPSSKFGDAVAYMNTHWKKLTRYLDDGRLEIDNNGAENKIRPFALGRKNWQFSGSPRGAKAASLFYSLIATAKESGLEPFNYLKYLFENIIYCQSEQDYTELLPFNCKDKVIN